MTLQETIALSTALSTLHLGDATSVLRLMPAESVHMVVTSPPYWNLRDYGTGTWEGGDPTCDHSAGNSHLNVGFNERSGYPAVAKKQEESTAVLFRDVCGKCGGKRIDYQMGSEPLHDCLGWATGTKCGECFICGMVDLFHEVKRVLRADGTCWIDIGDTYANDSKWGGSSAVRRDRQDKFFNGRAENPRERKVTGLPDKNKCLMPQRLALALQMDGWIVRSEIIWCLSPSTRVYARTDKGDGPRLLRDIARMDPSTVKLWNGERWTQVLGCSPTRCESPVRLTLRSGETISATPNHQWPLADGRLVKTEDLIVGDILSTTKLPEPNDPKGEELDELAWFAGLYLAEGSHSDDAIQISGHADETERMERVRSIAHRFGGSSVVHMGEGKDISQVVHGTILEGAIRHFVAGHTAKDKHIHPRAWNQSNSVLMSLLLGYLAGDGHHDEAFNRWRLGFTRNNALADSLRTLAARLGFTLTLNKSYSRMGRVKTFESYRGEIRFSRSGHHNERSRAEIVEIGSGCAGDYIDVGVEDEPHLFALASGVLTHNSKPNPLPSSVADRPGNSHETIWMLAKSDRYFYDREAVKESVTGNAHDRGNGINPKAAAAEIAGENIGSNARFARNTRDMVDRRNMRTVWTIAPTAYRDAHYATFPKELPSRCIKAGTSEHGVCSVCKAPWRRLTEDSYTSPGSRSTNGPRSMERKDESPGVARRLEKSTETVGWEPTCECENDQVIPAIVLDPFAGSGTTLEVANVLGRKGVGIELNPEDVARIKARLLSTTVNLFTAGINDTVPKLAASQVIEIQKTEAVETGIGASSAS